MNKQIIILIMMVVMISLVVADYPGENRTFTNELNGIAENCLIIINDTYQIELEFNSTLENITIFYPDGIPVGSFDIKCSLEEYVADPIEEEEEEESSGGGGWYTYPWRNKVNATSNETETNETIIEEVIEKEIIIEYSKPNWFWRIIGAIVCLVILILLIWLALRKSNKSRQLSSDYYKGN